MREDIVIVAAGRTALGTFGGSLSAIPASELGATVIKGLLERSGLKPEQINEVILGQVLTAGVGQNPARQAVLSAGLPVEVPADDHQQGLWQRLESSAFGVSSCRLRRC